MSTYAGTLFTRLMARPDIDALVRTVPCPFCLAPEGAYCVTSRGRFADLDHRERMFALAWLLVQSGVDNLNGETS